MIYAMDDVSGARRERVDMVLIPIHLPVCACSRYFIFAWRVACAANARSGAASKSANAQRSAVRPRRVYKTRAVAQR